MIEKSGLKTYRTLLKGVEPNLKGGYDTTKYLCSIWNKTKNV